MDFLLFFALPMLAAAGIPLYIHLPQFASINLGMGLGTVGVILMVIRVVDLVQDPLIGWAIDRWPKAQLGFGLAAAGGLAVSAPAEALEDGGMGDVIRVLNLSSQREVKVVVTGQNSVMAQTNMR